MKILFLTHSFNSFTQRLFVELSSIGHNISIEFDINDSVTIEAVELFKPDLIVAPYLKRAIPKVIWKNYTCFIVHPGIKGDRGISSLDWAILNSENTWGVTVLQANNEMDAGDIWSSKEFLMRKASKSSIYRNEFTNTAVDSVLEAVKRYESKCFTPEPLDYSNPNVRGSFKPAMKQAHRKINWLKDSTKDIIRKIRSADGFPGLLDNIMGVSCYLYNAFEDYSINDKAGRVIAKSFGAICIATVDGGVWISHLRPKIKNERTFKLPASMVLGDKLNNIPLVESFSLDQPYSGFREIVYEEKSNVAYLHFNFYNGAMTTNQCRRLLEVYRLIKQRDTKVIVLMGGMDFWSNGINLNVIEASDSPADESYNNINAINDLAKEIILTKSHITISALQGNTAAGGVFLALASDYVWARSDIILNPHYKNIGNLYGSEYWTYQLVKRVSMKKAKNILTKRLPIGAKQAIKLGLIDKSFSGNINSFCSSVEELASELANDPNWKNKIKDKADRRAKDESIKPLEEYRKEEMEQMKLNFYGFDPSYHVARYHFVYKTPHSKTPLHLAKHRNIFLR